MQPLPSKDSLEHRDTLPKHIKPINYDLTINPDMQAFTFKGHLNVELEVLGETDKVIMNSNQLTFDNVFITDKDNKKTVLESSLDEKAERVTFSASSFKLSSSQKYVLSIDYNGQVNGQMAGFYRSKYEDQATGQKHVLGVTQFEATDARKAFPCWDEPAVKATFDISIAVPSTLSNIHSYTILSNMDEESRRVEDGKDIIKFKRTPLISTYLVAWIIAPDFEHIDQTNQDGVLVRVWAQKNSINQGKFSLDVACRVLEFYKKYFNIAYPLPKLDMVAIPDFAAGAMENWGLVTYRTACLLYDSNESSLKAKQNIASVVAHELAHQWFGNLVTMEWWSDLWLNEGFATWASYLACNSLFPEWDLWTEFVTDDSQAGLSLDDLRSSHPIEVPVYSGSEIGQIFDSISYSKGASVIRMLASHMGHDAFRNGLCIYLNKHRYGNAKTLDLWSSLSTQTPGIAELMAQWTKEIGYPVVEIKESSTSNDNKLVLSQSRFLATGKAEPKDDQTVWKIPLFFAHSRSSWKIPTTVTNDSAYLMTLKEQTFDIPSMFPLEEGFKLNTTQAGFYRIHYTPSQWLALGQAAAKGLLSPSDRIGLISDLFSLSISDRLPLVECLNVIGQFGAQERDYLVWSELAKRLTYFQSIWWEEPEDVQSIIRQYIHFLCIDICKNLGFDPKPGEDDKTGLLRPLVISLAGRAGDQGVLSEARSRFDRYIKEDRTAIHPNLLSTVYSLMVRNGTRTEWQAVLDQYTRSNSAPDQKIAALAALGTTPDLKTVTDTLSMSLDSSSVVRAQDAIYLFRAVGSNNFANRRFAWSFLCDNWSALHTRYHSGSFALLSRIISYSTDSLSSTSDANSVESFFSPLDCSNIDRAIQQSIERIRMNAAWLDRNREPVAKWLATFASKVGRKL